MAPPGNQRRSKSRKRGGRRTFTKRTFKQNQYQTPAVEGFSSSSTSDTNTSALSASARKLNVSNEAIDSCENNIGHENYYMLLDSDILSSIVACIGICPEEDCSGKINFTNNFNEKYGLSCKLIFTCNSCDWMQYFYTSKEISTSTGRQPFDINLRTVAAFREVGKGHFAIEKVCGFMNLCPAMTIKAYKKTEARLYESYKKVAMMNTKQVTTDLRKEKLQEHFSEDGVIDIDASFDGTWQKRGYSSLNGVITAISRDSGKCFDYKVMSKTCSACIAWKMKEGTPEFDRFMADHKCAINYSGSAGAMEANGIVQVFKESKDVHKVRITNFINDGDSKSHASVVNADPYPRTIINKLECVGHVQKRCGSRLRNLKKNCKEKLEVNGKSVKVLQKLTHKYINKLQNCYGIAIRQTCKSGDVNVMQRAVGAVLYHYSQANDLAAQHQFCPQGSTSWCKYQADITNGTQTYVHKTGLPVHVCNKIAPIFQDLSSKDLLRKCLHGTTQNNNEALNGIIWLKCPKEVYVERFTLELGVCSAILKEGTFRH